jgi:hypothetical protein
VQRYKPKSKRRKMRQFQLEEISVVDNPAQKGAVMTIMKRAGELCVPPMKGQPMTSFEKLRREVAALNDKLDAVLKATARNGRTDLRDEQRTAPYRDEYQDEGEEFGEEFEKEPIDTMHGDRKRTAADHEGDWPGAGTEGAARQRRSNTRADGFVSGDESHGEMTPERASEILQPYAQDGEDEDEEAKIDEMEDVAKRFAERFPRANPDLVTKAAYHAVADARPEMGRERELMKRHLASQPVHKRYTDDDLLHRLEKRFGPGAVSRAVEMYRR